MAVAVDEADHLVLDLQPLHVAKAGGHVVGVDEGGHLLALQLLDAVAEGRLPGLVDADEAELAVADAEQVEGDGEEAGEVWTRRDPVRLEHIGAGGGAHRRR